MQLAGEITGYDQFNKSISSDGYSSMVQLKMTVNVRFTNNTNHDEDFERQFSVNMRSSMMLMQKYEEDGYG